MATYTLLFCESYAQGTTVIYRFINLKLATHLED